MSGKAQKKKKRGLGRPSTYTAARGRAVCKLLANGATLRQACRDLGLNESTVRGWTVDNEAFAAHYTRARARGYEVWADDIIEISDDGRNDWMERRGGYVVDREATDRSKLRVDARKWLLSKALPKVYGEKLDVNTKHDATDAFKAMWTALSAGTLAGANS